MYLVFYFEGKECVHGLKELTLMVVRKWDEKKQSPVGKVTCFVDPSSTFCCVMTMSRFFFFLIVMLLPLMLFGRQESQFTWLLEIFVT